MFKNTSAKIEKTFCYHCGDEVIDDLFEADNRLFCCMGCQSVYQILHSNDLQQYYSYNKHPGKANKKPKENYDYLDEEDIVAKLVDFQDDKITNITFFIPVIHCSSCVWLLENLYKFHSAIQYSQTDFLKKQLSVTFRHNELSLKELVELLESLGYEPKITLQDVVKESEVKKLDQRELVRKITVAGFCFGNAMMLSFPEYLGLAAYEVKYSAFFGYFNLLLTLPVMGYSAIDYYKSSYHSLKNRQLNLDVPLALGIFVLFARTAFDVMSQSGGGFADTLCSLVFFLLIGKFVQQKTYHHISFERDYRSYFPVAITKIEEKKERPVQLSDLNVGDRIFIRNNEIIPADSILLRGDASLDFSFVTGESEPVKKVVGEIVYAGARQMDSAIELEVIKPVSQSYLTKLWNNKDLKKTNDVFKSFSDTVSQYFTPALLTLSVFALVFWAVQGDAVRGWNAFTAMLIIACPCALALTSPFTFSAALSIFDKNHLFVKNALAIEKMAKIDTLVFDKTGTISSPASVRMRLEGKLNARERKAVAVVCKNSNHPMSREIVKWLGINERTTHINEYQEIPGKGMIAVVDGERIKIGSSDFVKYKTTDTLPNGSKVFVSIEEELKACFILEQPWRKGMETVMRDFSYNYQLHLISGDNDKDKKVLSEVFPVEAHLLFNQLPHQKLDFVHDLQQAGHSVAMFGDGLNDAGALKQSDLGVAVSDDVNNFSPGCDAILDGVSFHKTPKFFSFSKDTIRVIHRSFALSILYNIVGLSFAIQGTMSPLVAAIIMPLSTLTVISFTTLSTRYFARKNKLTYI